MESTCRVSEENADNDRGYFFLYPFLFSDGRMAAHDWHHGFLDLGLMNCLYISGHVSSPHWLVGSFQISSSGHLFTWVKTI